MEKKFRLRKNYQFNYVYKNGKSVSDENLVVIFCRNKNGKPKVGFSVSKKYGKAVKRNRIRRQLKEIVNQRYFNLDKQYNYIFIPRPSEVVAAFKDLEKSADRIIEKIKNKAN